MSSSWSSTSQPKPKRDQLTKWRDSTNDILDYYQVFLQYGSITDHVQLSSLKDMNNALPTADQLSYDERLDEAKKYNFQAQHLGNKLQILFHRQKGTEHSAYVLRYAFLDGKGYGVRTEAAEAAASTDDNLVTIDPLDLCRSPTW